jgi:hypothetical protein
MTTEPSNRWVHDFIPGAGAQFRLSRDFTDSFVRETREAKCMTCWLGSSLAGSTPIRIAATLSDMSYCLTLLSSHSVFCFNDAMDKRMMIMVMFIMIITILLYL